MLSRNELGNALLECLKEVSSLLECAHSVALKQQNALVESNAENIALTCAAQEEVLRRISEADQRAAAIATQLAEMDGLDSETADTEAVAQAAGFPYSNMIRQEMSRIPHLSKKVQDANEINRTLLDNGLDIIACCLRTVANDPGPSAYSKDANFIESQVSTLSLDSRA